jgi:hypothetical protein
MDEIYLLFQLAGSIQASDLTSVLGKLFKPDLGLGITENQLKNRLDNRGRAFVKLFTKQFTKGWNNFTKRFGIKLYCVVDWKSITEFESNNWLFGKC